MALWSLILQVKPRDHEAEQKTKDLADTDTIARGNYEGALTGGTLARPGAPGGQKPADESASLRDSEQPESHDRVARDAAVIRARIDADPTNPNGYLQL